MSESASPKTPHTVARLVVALVVATLGTDRAAADTSAMLRCRQLADPAARLACYDAVVLPGGPAPTGGRDSATSPAAPAPVVSSPKPPEKFGLESRKALAPEVPFIESSIPGRFDGWVPGQRIRMANGQLWEVTDGSQAAYRLSDPKVKISRGFSGSFFMEIQGVSQTPRVRRVE